MSQRALAEFHLSKSHPERTHELKPCPPLKALLAPWSQSSFLPLMGMKDFWRLSPGCPTRCCDSGFISDTRSSAKASRGSSLRVQLCPRPQPQAWSSQRTAGSGGAAAKDWTPPAGHTPLTHAFQAGSFIPSLPLPGFRQRSSGTSAKTSVWEGDEKETLETSFSTVRTQCFSTFSSPPPPHSPPPPQVHKTAGAFYSKLPQLPEAHPHLCWSAHLPTGATARWENRRGPSLPPVQPLPYATIARSPVLLFWLLEALICSSYTRQLSTLCSSAELLT